MLEKVLKLAKNTILYIQEHGINYFVRELIFRASNNYHEQRLSVDTRGYINPDDLGFANAEFHAYATTGYKAIYKMLRMIPIDYSESTFIDYGCGKGRAIVVAATFPFKRVIGIEISDPLIEIARNNAQKMRYKRAVSIDLYQTDAAQYTVSKDVNVIYFFNPFKGQVLQAVINKIYDSYKECPRRIYFVYFNDRFFKKVIADQDWITPVYETNFYPTDSCGIYVTNFPMSSTNQTNLA